MMQYIPQPLLIGRRHNGLLHDGGICPLHLYIFKSTPDSTNMAIRHIVVHKVCRYAFWLNIMMLLFIG